MKLVVLALLLASVTACSNSSQPEISKDSTGVSTNTVENVNGNVPDTTSGLQLNQPLPVDSSGLRDTTKR